MQSLILSSEEAHGVAILTMKDIHSDRDFWKKVNESKRSEWCMEESHAAKSSFQNF